MKYCDVIEENALKIGAVNTIVKKEGKVSAIIQIFMVFDIKLEKATIDPENKNSYLRKRCYLSNNRDSPLFFRGKGSLKFSRSRERSFEDLMKHRDGEIIVNCTPVGMYPNNLDSIVDLKDFPLSGGLRCCV